MKHNVMVSMAVAMVAVVSMATLSSADAAPVSTSDGQNWSHFELYTLDQDTGYQKEQNADNIVSVIQDNKLGTQYLVVHLPNGQYTVVPRVGLDNTACYVPEGLLCIPANTGVTSVTHDAKLAVTLADQARIADIWVQKFKNLLGEFFSPKG